MNQRVLEAMVLVCLAVGLCQADVTDQHRQQAALAAVRRAAGTAKAVTGIKRFPPSTWVIVDGRWHVTFLDGSGEVRSVADDDFAKSEHARHVLNESPESAEILRVGQKLVQRVFPGIDMREMTLTSTEVVAGTGRVRAGWARVISENGFRDSATCRVEYCWQDRAIFEVAARCPPTPDEWRRPETVTAAQAEEAARRALGDLGGGWLEVCKDRCVINRTNVRPAWQVYLRRRWYGAHGGTYVDRGVWVDPWTGEVLRTATFDSAAGAPGQAPRSPIGPATTDMPAHAAPRPWVPWAGGAAALLVLVLSVALVCLRRRRG